jgi:shikimate kinase
VFVWVIILVAITGGISMAEEPWRQEMDAVCSRTQDSMSLSLVELKQLVERCDKLKPTIEAQEESTRKVFRKRLQLCRDLYAFVLKSKEQEKK